MPKCCCCYFIEQIVFDLNWPDLCSSETSYFDFPGHDFDQLTSCYGKHLEPHSYYPRQPSSDLMCYNLYYYYALSTMLF